MSTEIITTEEMIAESVKQAWIFDDLDDRDEPFEKMLPLLGGAKTSNTSDYISIIPEHTPISSQGSSSTCVANAGMDMFEILLGLEAPDKVVQLSRLFSYWCSRYLHNATHKDAGTQIRAMMYQAKKIGVVEEKYFPFSDNLNDILRSPETDLYMMASNNRLTGYYKINSKGDKMIDQMETAIRANHPIVFGMMVNKDFQRYKGGNHVWKTMDDTHGGHAMLITGVRNKGGREFWIRNSWGESWGDKGHCWMHEDLIKLAHDPWVGTRLKGII